MSNFIKPTDLNEIWAATGDVVKPTISKISLGWEVEVPTRQHFNWILNRTDKFMAHVNERGIPEWDNKTKYLADKSYVQGQTGELFIALTDNFDKKPEDNPDHWVSLIGMIHGGSVAESRRVIAGDGLTGGGNLEADRTFTLGVGGAVSTTSTNAVTADSHTHALSTGVKTSLGLADTAVQPARTITAGTGLTGGGNLSANRTISVNFGETAGTVARGDDPRFDGAGEWSAPIVTQAEAEAGTSTAPRKWTAQRVRQAIVAWYNTVSSPLSRTFMTRTTAAQMRSDLGLGTAATGTVTTGVEDITVGRVLRVGDFGLGGVAVNTQNFDDLRSGFYAFGSNKPASVPVAIPTFSMVFENRLSVNNAGRFFMATNSNEIWMQTKSSGTWRNPARVWTEYSFNPTSKVDTTRTITGTGALTGGGTLAANRTIDASAATKASLAKADSSATASTQIIAGNGLSGGGNLSANRTITLGTPSTLTSTTTNTVGATNHSHALDTVLNKTDTAGGNRLVTQGWMGYGGAAPVTTNITDNPWGNATWEATAPKDAPAGIGGYGMLLSVARSANNYAQIAFGMNNYLYFRVRTASTKYPWHEIWTQKVATEIQHLSLGGTGLFSVARSTQVLANGTINGSDLAPSSLKADGTIRRQTQGVAGTYRNLGGAVDGSGGLGLFLRVT